MASPTVLYQAGNHAGRPANGSGCVLYSCTDHDLVYRDDGTSWTTFMTLVGGSGGDIATDAIWDAAGDLVQGSGANTGAKLTAGTAGMFLKSAGAAAANLWGYAPGHELDYVEFTGAVNITATTVGSANTVVTGNAVAYDGSTVVIIEFFCPQAFLAATKTLNISLADGGTAIGYLGVIFSSGSGTDQRWPVMGRRKLTPSAATHTYSVRAHTNSGTQQLEGGAGGSGVLYPGYIRITKA